MNTGGSMAYVFSTLSEWEQGTGLEPPTQPRSYPLPLVNPPRTAPRRQVRGEGGRGGKEIHHPELFAVAEGGGAGRGV